MKVEIQAYENFKGILESIAEPPPNSFEDLINLRNDRKLGGLVNRYGFQFWLQTASVPDAFAFTSFPDSADSNGNSETLVLVDSTAVRARPPIDFEGGSNQSGLLDLTTPIAGTYLINTIVNNVITLQSNLPSNNIYDIVFNQTRNQYAVVTTYTSVSQFSINIGQLNVWANNDVLQFFQSDLLLSSFARTITGFPYLQTIDSYNNLLLSGEKENTTGQSLWIGRIGTKIGAAGDGRRYFGSDFDSVKSPNSAGFKFNGIYPGRLAEDFSIGAFQSGLFHIHTELVAAPITNITILPNSDIVSYGGQWYSESSPPPPFYTHINDGNPSSYVYAVSGNNTNYFKVGFQPVSTGLIINRNGFVTLTVTARMGTSVFGAVCTGIIEVFENVNGTDVSRGRFGIAMINGGYGSPTAFQFQISCGAFTDINKLSVQYNATGGNTTFVVIDFSITVDVSVATTAVTTGISAPVYALNFSMELDEFQETSLIYSGPYAGSLVNNTTSYLVTNQVNVGANNTVNQIGVKICTPLAALINRRGTALKVYGGVFTAGVWVWRFCQRIDFSNPGWTFDTNVSSLSNQQYKIEIVVGNEINTGPVYEDQNKRANNSILQKSIVTASKPSSRTFGINEVDKQTIYFSSIDNNGYETSMIPSSNFIVVNDTIGDITFLYSINSFLLVFKRQSVLSIPAYVAATSPRVNIVTREHGLASARSVCANGTQVAYVSYDGIYITDGAKSQLLNPQWKEYFRTTYSQSVLESSIGFYDQFSDSFYFQFRLSSTTSELWAFCLDTDDWRKDEFVIQEASVGEIFGLIAYASKSLDNRMVFADDPRTNGGGAGSHFQLYKYPRVPIGSAVDYTNSINTVNGLLEWNTHIRFKTNPVDDGGGIEIANYIDGQYFKSSGKTTDGNLFYNSIFPTNHPTVPSTAVTSVNLLIYDGTTIVKTIPIQWGRQESTVTCRFPLSRFALYNEFWLHGLFFIRAFGVYYKKLIKAGSIKQVG